MKKIVICICLTIVLILGVSIYFINPSDNYESAIEAININWNMELPIPDEGLCMVDTKAGFPADGQLFIVGKYKKADDLMEKFQWDSIDTSIKNEIYEYINSLNSKEAAKYTIDFEKAIYTKLEQNDNFLFLILDDTYLYILDSTI